ncbi:MAG: hypothetical protein ACYDBJ_01730 [Aggregatilineales bacterium]
MNIRLQCSAFLFGLLLSACSVPAMPTASPIPTVLPTVTSAVPTATDIPTLLPTDTPNLTPSATSALVSAASLMPNTTPSAKPFVPQPGDPPPLTIQLPSGWHATFTQVPVSDQLSQALVNVAAYAGPVGDGGTGFIYILWNYPSLVPVNPGALPTSAADLVNQQLLSDGLRLLRGTVLDASCTFGNYGHTDFTVGGQAAVGQLFQAAACQDNSPDVAGWYAGLRQAGKNLLFYAYIQPVSAYNNGRADVQRILDSVIFSATTSTPIRTPVISPSSTVPPRPTLAPTAIPTGTPELD